MSPAIKSRTTRDSPVMIGAVLATPLCVRGEAARKDACAVPVITNISAPRCNVSAWQARGFCVSPAFPFPQINYNSLTPVRSVEGGPGTLPLYAGSTSLSYGASLHLNCGGWFQARHNALNDFSYWLEHFVSPDLPVQRSQGERPSAEKVSPEREEQNAK